MRDDFSPTRLARTAEDAGTRAWFEGQAAEVGLRCERDGRAAVTIENMTAQFDPTVGCPDVEALREAWPGALVVKGALGSEGARRAVAELREHGERFVRPAAAAG